MIIKETILISGIDGFLGMNLFNTLKMHYNIIGVDIATDNFVRIDKDMLMELKYYESSKLEAAFVENKIDYVIHTATHHCKYYQAMQEVFATNIDLGLRLLDCSNKNGIKCFVNMDSILSKEINLYSFTKNLFRESLVFLSNDLNVNIVNIKLDMMYGAFSGSHNFIQNMFEKLAKNETEINLTEGKQKRSFLYIKDIVTAIAMIIKNEHIINQKYNEFYLIHPVLNSVKDVMETLKEITQSSTKLNFGALPYRNNEIMETSTEYSIYISLSWSPEYSLKKGLIEMSNETTNKIYPQ
jgi:CDP-paratose synthetase